VSGLLKWLAPLLPRRRTPTRRRAPFRPVLERLETREVLSGSALGAVQDSGGDPATFAVVASDGNSLWEYNPLYNPGAPIAQHWIRLTPANVAQISATRDSAGDPVVFAVIASDGNALWEYNPQYNPGGSVDAHWFRLTGGNVAQISATQDSGGDPVVFAAIASGGNSLWEYNPQYNATVSVAAHWYEVTPASVSQVSATRNANSDPVAFATIGSDGNTLWDYNPQIYPGAPLDSHWVQLTPASVSHISATQNAAGDPVVFAVVASAGSSLWYYNPQLDPIGPVAQQWIRLTPAGVSQISATQDSGGDPVVFATISTAGNSLWEYNPQVDPGGPVDFQWYEITSARVGQISATQDPAGDPAVYATIASAGASLWGYNPLANPTGALNDHWYETSPAAVA
jgi:outer membrane lipoprotein-sorting protein